MERSDLVAPTTTSSTADVWFTERPRWAMAVTAALFLAVLLLRLMVGSPTDAYSLFYALPVALAASAFGLRGGISAGLLTIPLIAVWVVTHDVPLSPLSWLSRVVPLLLLGVLLGRAVDRGRRAEEERRQAEEARSQAQVAAMLHREAIEINDTLIQQLAAAKWAFEAGRTEAGLDALTDAVRHAQELVSGLIRRADMGGFTEPTQWRSP